MKHRFKTQRDLSNSHNTDKLKNKILMKNVDQLNLQINKDYYRYNNELNKIPITKCRLNISYNEKDDKEKRSDLKKINKSILQELYKKEDNLIENIQFKHDQLNLSRNK